MDNDIMEFWDITLVHGYISSRSNRNFHHKVGDFTLKLQSQWKTASDSEGKNHEYLRYPRCSVDIPRIVAFIN